MNWKLDLIKLKLDYLEQTTPQAFKVAGGREMKSKPYNDHSLNGLITAILDYFKYSGIKAERTGKDVIKATYKGHPVEIKVDFGSKPLTKETVNKLLQEIDKGIFITARRFDNFLVQWKAIKTKLKSSIFSQQIPA